MILQVSVEDVDGLTAEGSTRVLVGATGLSRQEGLDREQANAIAVRPEHGRLGTQLGPNKNGRKQ